MTTGLTPQQDRALGFIRGYIAETGLSPSYSDICKGLGISSKSGVHRLVHGLAKRGLIEIDPEHSRSIRLLGRGLTLPPLPPEISAALEAYALANAVTPEAMAVLIIEDWIRKEGST